VFFYEGARSDPAEVSAFVDSQRERFAVELPHARGLYVGLLPARDRRALGARSRRRAPARTDPSAPRREHHAYGARRMWKALPREGEDVGRDRVARLMCGAAIQGAKRRGKPWRTTTPDPEPTSTRYASPMRKRKSSHEPCPRSDTKPRTVVTAPPTSEIALRMLRTLRNSRAYVYSLRAVDGFSSTARTTEGHGQLTKVWLGLGVQSARGAHSDAVLARRAASSAGFVPSVLGRLPGCAFRLRRCQGKRVYTRIRATTRFGTQTTRLPRCPGPA